MPTRLWEGDASRTAQIRTAQLWTGTWTGDGAIRTTMTAENGTTTQTETTSTSNAAQDVVRDAHLATLQSSTQSLFTAVTWATSGTDSFTGTAKEAGVPFYSATTESTDDTAGSIASDSTTTTNSGPNDWNTAANWTGSTVPVTGDTVQFADTSIPVYYGLSQTGADLAALYIAPGYTGSIGDPVNKYYLTAGTSNTTAVINSNGAGVWLKGTWTNVYVSRGRVGPNSTQLDGTITNLYVGGTSVQGTISVADSATVTNFYQTGAPSARTLFGSSVTSTLYEVDSGTFYTESTPTTANISGQGTNATFQDTGTNTVTTFTMKANPRVNFNSGGTITTFNVLSGYLDFRDNRATSVTVTNLEFWAGTINEQSGLNNISWPASGNTTIHSGATFLPDSSTSIDLG